MRAVILLLLLNCLYSKKCLFWGGVKLEYDVKIRMTSSPGEIARQHVFLEFSYRHFLLIERIERFVIVDFCFALVRAKSHIYQSLNPRQISLFSNPAIIWQSLLIQ